MKFTRRIKTLYAQVAQLTQTDSAMHAWMLCCFFVDGRSKRNFIADFFDNRPALIAKRQCHVVELPFEGT